MQLLRYLFGVFPSETAEDEVKTNQSAPLEETAAVLTNGSGGDLEADTNHDPQSTTNGPAVASEAVISMKLEPGSSLGVSEAEPGQVPNVNINEVEEEEEEGTLVMRAERVIITDEGDDVPEDLTPQEDQQEAVQSEESPPPNPEAGQEGGDAEVVNTEAAPETFTQPENSKAAEPTAEEQPATGDDGDVQDDEKTNAVGDTKDEESVDQAQPPDSALEGTAVVSVPVYSEAQPSAIALELEAEGEVAASPEGAEAAVKAPEAVTLSGQFQDVPLADPQDNQRTEARPGEREPLLSQAKAPDTRAEPAAAAAVAAASTETHSPTRASQGEETQAPKHKTCQCCSVM